MLNFELFVDNIKLPLFEGQNVNINDTIRDVRDISKIFTPYSTELVIPASSKANQLFRHYYRLDILNGFDARYKIDCIIKLNGIDYKKGKIELKSVDLKNEKPESYRIVFYGETVDLKDLLGEDELSSLSFLDNFSLPYSLTEIKTRMSTGLNKTINSEVFNSVIRCPLISTETLLYYDNSELTSEGTGNLAFASGKKRGTNYRNLKYSIRIWAIIRAIEEKYTIANGYNVDIIFSRDFFNTTNLSFYDLYLFLHRVKEDTEAVETYSEVVTGWSAFSFSGGEVVSSGTNFTINTLAPQERVNSTLNINTASSSPYTVNIYRNGILYEQVSNIIGNTSITLNNQPLGIYYAELETTSSVSFSSLSWYYELTEDIDGIDVLIDSRTSNKGVFVVTANSVFYPTKQAPKIKVIDFLGGLFKAFNLVAYIENKTLIVKTRSAYYGNGNFTDISKYVDISSRDVSPLNIYKNIDFKFKGNKYLLTKNHLEQFNKNYGELTFNTGFTTGVDYTIELPFSKMKYERLFNEANDTLTNIQIGLAVGSIDNNGNATAIVDLPLLHYCPLSSGQTIGIYDSTSVQSTSIFFVPSNSRLLTDSQTINFGSEINEYSGTVFNTSLFETYYKAEIEGLFRVTGRILKIKAKLPLNILLNYRLNDVFIINGYRFNINSIKSNLKNGESNLELINL